MGKSRIIGGNRMKLLFLLVILPIAMVIDLVRTIQGKPTVDEEWHEVYIESNMNHGQGRKDDE